MSLNPILFIQGPTATGKTDLAIEVAKEIDGVIVNCDSIQAYKEVDIGSAKPSKDEMGDVPYELFDFISPPDELTAGRYRELALEVIRKHPNRPIIFVGGSGFYFMALEKGMFDVKPVADSILVQIQKWKEQFGDEYLHEKLKALDSAGAEQIQKQDSYRTIRALSLVLSEKKNVKGNPKKHVSLK